MSIAVSPVVTTSSGSAVPRRRVWGRWPNEGPDHGPPADAHAVLRAGAQDIPPEDHGHARARARAPALHLRRLRGPRLPALGGARGPRPREGRPGRGVCGERAPAHGDLL